MISGFRRSAKPFDDAKVEESSEMYDDLFFEDAQMLLNGVEDEPVDDEENALHLDEVPFDRDIRYINVAVASQPKPKLYVVPGSSKRVMQQVNLLTSANQGEIKKLDDHYKKLDDLKKAHDSKHKGRRTRKPRSDGTHDESQKKESGAQAMRLAQNPNSKGKTSSSKAVHPQTVTNPARSYEYDTSLPTTSSPAPEIKFLESSLDITDAYIPSYLRIEAPEFVPYKGFHSNSMGDGCDNMDTGP